MKELAEEFSLEEAVIRAVAKVESGGRGGFDRRGLLTALYEPHVAYRQTLNPLKRSKLVKAGLGCKRWGDIPYPRGSLEERNSKNWERIRLASEIIGPEPAHRSASYGKFQIMGFNYKPAGYSSALELVKAYWTGEEEQLRSFLRFIASNKKLYRALKDQDWATFARLYNGPGYKKNNYDRKLMEAYWAYLALERVELAEGQETTQGVTRFVMRGHQGEEVKSIQTALIQKGFDLEADGVFGPQTQRAVKGFQRANGLRMSGVVDSATLAKLQES